IDRARRLGEQAGRRLRFRERNHLANGLRARHHHYQAVEAEGDASVRRTAVLERVEQEAELLLRLLRADAEHAEYRLLHLWTVDADGAAAEFGAVHHHVVGARER